MVRPVGATHAATYDAIREAAVRLIARYGFEAMTLRMLADEIGIQAGSLYHYFTSKQELLFMLLSEIMKDLLAQYDREVAPVADPAEQLAAFVRLHLDFHMRRKEEAFVGNTELRGLTPEHYREMTRLRDEYAAHLTGIIERGVKAGLFRVTDARIAAFASIAMLTGVCNWYRPDGRLSPVELIRQYTEMAVRLLGAPGGKRS